MATTTSTAPTGPPTQPAVTEPVAPRPRLTWGFERPIARDPLAVVALVVAAFNVGRNWEGFLELNTDAGALALVAMVPVVIVLQLGWACFLVGTVGGSLRAFWRGLRRR